MLKYIKEIKNRTFLLLLTWLVSVLSCYIYKETLLFVICVYPLLSALPNNRESLFYFICTDLLEVFSAYINLVGFASFYVGAFYFMYHSFFFFAPSFFSWEYFYLSLFLKINTSVFFFFVLLASLVFLPYCWNFFLGFQDFVMFDPSSLRFEAKLSEYLSFFFSLLSFSIVGSQFFSMLLFLSVALNFRVQTVIKWRKIFYCLFLLFATAASPPDVFSQMTLGFILLSTYELFVFAHCFKHICVSLEER